MVRDLVYKFDDDIYACGAVSRLEKEIGKLFIAYSNHIQSE